MSRTLAGHGTWAAYKRHKRKGEEACAECAEAARQYNRDRREKERAARHEFPEQITPDKVTQAQTVRARRDIPAGYEIVNQLVAYGHVKEVPVPTFEDPLKSARWRRARIRAALMVANPRDVAPLAKAEQECIDEINRLSEASKPRGESALDKLAAKRAERMAAAARTDAAAQ